MTLMQSTTARITHDFTEFRTIARRLLAREVAPGNVRWLPSDGGLFGTIEDVADDTTASSTHRVPKEFMKLAEHVICHRDDERCALLYRTLWRVTHGERELLDNALDEDVFRLLEMEKSVRRDSHKMTAFVRFRKIDGTERYMAWHRPDHLVVRLKAPFFVDRFKSMRWMILTPDESMTWDGKALRFGPGVRRDPFEGSDDVESLWTTYYANIFNPARIKLDAMRNEMPRKHWPTMPETKLIPEMLAAAPARVERMIKQGRLHTTATHLVPAERSLPVLQAAAARCDACEICRNAIQVVFGEGPADAKVMIVAEQPGDQEDRVGRPFVGPAGQVFDDMLLKAGLNRPEMYITAAVKHFKFEQRGVRRIHSKPSAREINACRPWLEAQLETIRPQILVLMGNSAAHSVIGHHIRVTRDRGVWMKTRWCERTMLTFHPSAILRAMDDSAKADIANAFYSDLVQVAEAARLLSSARH